jgi:hypothetical protein
MPNHLRSRTVSLLRASVTVLAFCHIVGVSPRLFAQSSEQKDEVKQEAARETEAEIGAPTEEDENEKVPPPPRGPAGQLLVPLPPPPNPPSLFVFSFKGTVALTLYGQDTPTYTGSGGSALLGPVPLLNDSWQMGGDIRQTRMSFNVRGPELLGATPLANIEFEMFGGNQITTIAAPPAVAVVRDTMGNPIGTANVPMFTSSAQGDESLLPRLRTAYLEFSWEGGKNLIRAGQYHNLLLAMVSSSGAHPATLGYGGGQLGWRAPGITYSHKFFISPDLTIDTAVQVNRNSWNDNASTCVPNSPAVPPSTNCLPSGVSLGEAGFPQVEARIMLYGAITEPMFPYYAPTAWQFHVVGHWDVKDLSGVNNVAPVGMRDSLTTYAIESGGKFKLGPFQLAANGWYGQNTGSVFGNLFQIQTPDKPDVSGMGMWSQVGLKLNQYFSFWLFGGIDRPNRTQALAASFVFLQNLQLAGMLAYVNGPFIASLEWFTIVTTSVVGRAAATATAPANPGVINTYRGNQPSFTVAYSF